MIILDTNVLSELMAPIPAESVVAWIAERKPTSLYTTSVTRAELLYGVHLLPKGKRRDDLKERVDIMFDKLFAGHVLPFGDDAASSYARIAAERVRRGRTMPTLDAQIAAIAHALGATLATRNVADFDGCGIDVIDPWA